MFVLFGPVDAVAASVLRDLRVDARCPADPRFLDQLMCGKHSSIISIATPILLFRREIQKYGYTCFVLRNTVSFVRWILPRECKKPQI